MSKILIVDDSVLSQTMSKRILLSEGFEVVLASDGAAGLNAIESEKPDCVILDLLMPVLDGFGVLEALKEKGIKTPVIVVSADIQETTRTRVIDFGAIRIMNKPANKEQLIGAVREVLVRSSQEAA